MASTLIAHVDCKYKTRDELANLPTPAPTRTWRPIPHWELATQLIGALADRGISVVREQYAVGGVNQAKLFGALDLRVDGLDDDQIGTSLGIRAANDKSMKLSAIAAARVFVCDNMAFSGSGGAVLFSKMHTSGLNVAEIIPPAIDMYLDKAGVWRADIERMKDYDLSDGRAKELIYDAFLGRRAVLPMRLLDDVHQYYFDDEIQRSKFEDRTLWSLNNAFTEAVKDLGAVPQQRRGVEIGRFFGKVLARGQHVQIGGGYIPTRVRPGRVR